MKTIALKIPDDLLSESGRLANDLHLSRAEYIRLAIGRMNRSTLARLRARRIAEASRRVRGESMRVNAEFAAFERDCKRTAYASCALRRLDLSPAEASG